MSSGSISSQTQISLAESTKTSISLAHHQNLQEDNLEKNNKDTDSSDPDSMIQIDKKRKKLVWKQKERLQLQLQFNEKQNYNHINLKGSAIKNNNNTIDDNNKTTKTIVFSPLRLKNLTLTNNPTKKSATISLSAKCSYKFFPTLSIAHSNSPVIITSNLINNSKPLNPNNNNNNGNNNNTNKIMCYKNDYSNNYIHSGKLPFKYVRNAKQQVEGYPKLQKLYKLKEQQIEKYSTRPYGCRIDTENMSKVLNSWVYDHSLQFDVIMIGALTENQLIYPLLTKLPIDKLCSKPGFLFIWASTKKISELSTLINDSRTWSKKFRRSEELVFIPIDKNSVYYPKEWSIPEDQILEEVQWHCWMCITGTVRRSTDKDLIHCNVNTDLSLENSSTGNSAVPSQIYKVVENFSSSTRRLHIIPTSTGLKKHVKIRPGWVIVSPDVILDNFDPERYKRDIESIGSKIPYNEEIEQLRPKTPV